MTIIATKLTAAKANKAIAFFFNDLLLFSSLTFLKKAWQSNNAQIDIKADKNNGRDLKASLKAASAELLTMEPTQSANAYIALKNVKAEKRKNTMIAIETIKD